MNQQQALTQNDTKLLSGVKILDLTRVVSGPYATMQLGDLGAQIIKIEEPVNGDDSRAFGPPFIGGESAYFLSVNRNKQSVAIDLKSPAGKELLLKLVESSDVLVENFRPGTMARLGLGAEALKARNPSLIHCSITGFGTTGPDSQRPGYDLILQGESGIMDITGDPQGQPTKVGTSIGDMIAGLYATQAILAALLKRQNGGEAHSVHVSMLDSLSSLLTFNAGIYYATGVSPTRRGNEHPTICPYETFQVSDGWLNLGVANDKFWHLFCEVTGAKHLEADSRFRSAPDRVSNRADLRPLVADLLIGKTRAFWMSAFGEAGIPCGEIKTIQEVCEAEQLQSRGMIIKMEHPTAGTVLNIDSPIRVDDQNATDDCAPPLLGQHTRTVLQSLAGLSETHLDELEQAGVIRSNDQHAR